MEEELLAVTVGKNITKFRKAANMTQLDLAEKLNYSDKSVSKWEQGNAVPDVRILMQMAQLFGVTLDDFVSDNSEKKVVPKREKRKQRIITVIASAGLCWLVAVICFVGLLIFAPEGSSAYRNAWLAFVYALPASAIVLVVFSALWRWKAMRFLSISLLVWAMITAFYLTAFVVGQNWWQLFLIGIPLQILALVYFVFFKRTKREKP